MEKDDNDPASSHSDLKEAWDVAERALKEVELATGQLCVSAINELRYAGTHFQRSGDTNNDTGKKRGELYKAVRHCARAKYDCYEYGCLYFLIEFEKFEKIWVHSMDYVQECVPDYIEKRKIVREIKEGLSEVDRSGNGNRDTFANFAKSAMTDLKKISEGINDARPVIAAKVRRHSAIVRRQVLTGIFICVLGALLAYLLK